MKNNQLLKMEDLSLNDELLRQSRKEAIEYLEHVRKTNPLKMTTEEVIRLKNYGRK